MLADHQGHQAGFLPSILTNKHKVRKEILPLLADTLPFVAVL